MNGYPELDVEVHAETSGHVEGAKCIYCQMTCRFRNPIRIASINELWFGCSTCGHRNELEKPYDLDRLELGTSIDIVISSE